MTRDGETLELRVPVGRFWGITSRALAVDPSRPYGSALDLVVPTDGVRGARSCASPSLSARARTGTDLTSSPP